MYAKHLILLLVVVLAVVHALPATEKRYTLKPGMKPIKVAKGTHAYKRDVAPIVNDIDLSKRIVIVEPNGTLVRPGPVGPNHKIQPDKRYIIEGPDGEQIRPPPAGPGHVMSLKRAPDDETSIRSTTGSRGATPFNRI